MSDVTESRWYKVLFFSFSLVSTVIFAYNVYNYYQLLNQKIPSTGLSQGEIKAALILNIIMLVFSVILLIYSLWKLVFSKSSRSRITGAVQEAAITEKGGFSPFKPESKAPVSRIPIKTPGKNPGIGMNFRTNKFAQHPTSETISE